MKKAKRRISGHGQFVSVLRQHERAEELTMPENEQAIGQERQERKVRYAVVGLGYIAQIAVLPAFKHARDNSVLAALVSSDPEKLKTLGRRYRVKQRYSYDKFDDCLNSGEIDAVYIALPNHMHSEYTCRAAR